MAGGSVVVLCFDLRNRVRQAGLGAAAWCFSESRMGSFFDCLDGKGLPRVWEGIEDAGERWKCWSMEYQVSQMLD